VFVVGKGEDAMKVCAQLELRTRGLAEIGGPKNPRLQAVNDECGEFQPPLPRFIHAFHLQPGSASGYPSF
jgi:hypothetical protein